MQEVADHEKIDERLREVEKRLDFLTAEIKRLSPQEMLHVEQKIDINRVPGAKT